MSPVHSFVHLVRAILLLSAPALAGCALFQSTPYQERYEIKHLTVVLMDEESIRSKWEEISRKPAVKIVTIGAEPSTQVKTVRGIL